MSSRRKSRRNRAESRVERPDVARAAPSAAGIRRRSSIPTVILAALAAIISAVFLVQLFDPAGMPAAMLLSEIRQLSEPDDSASAALLDRKPTWRTLVAERDAALKNLPEWPRHLALAYLLDLTAKARRNPAAHPDAVAAAQGYANQDPENLLARLAHASIADHAAQSQSAAARFEAFRRIVDAQSPAKYAKLYNEELARVWHDILKRHIRRPDTARAIVDWASPYLITQHYAAMPIIAGDLLSLAEQLSAEGHSSEADRCRAWLAEATRGLIKSERDAGTRLLCVDALVRTFPATSYEAHRLRTLRDDFLAAADAAPADLTDPFKRPAAAPAEYRRAQRLLVLALAFGGEAAGCLMLLAVITPLSLIRYVTRRSAPRDSGRPRWGAWTLESLILFGALAALTTILIDLEGWYSASSIMVRAAVVVMGALLVCVLLTAIAGRPEKQPQQGDAAHPAPRSPRRAILIVILLLLVLAVDSLQGDTLAAAGRRVDLLLGSFTVVLLATMSVLAIVVVTISQTGPRLLAKTALFGWCLNIGLAFVILQMHRSADAALERVAPDARADEILARLPDNNWEACVTEIRRHFDTSQP